MRYSITGLLCVVASLLAHADVTVEACVGKAMANYPLVRQYGLMAATRDVDLSDINRSWLPRIGVYGQVTAQNSVPSFPESLAGVLDRMGQQMKGLDKVQYKAGVDLSQTIWDGGVASARRELVRSQEAAQEAALEADLYPVRQRVENLYFAILLTEEQIAQSLVTQGVLTSNLETLRSMLRNGTATQADVDMVEAQTLVLNQSIAQARSAADGYRRVLELFIGESLAGQTLLRPEAGEPLSDDPDRPELRLMDRRIAANQATDRLADTSLLPKVGLFAQAYYGYPGLDYFRSMMNGGWSFNILAGLKVSWTIDSFYTKKNTSRRTSLTEAEIAIDRDLFLFNTRLQSASQRETIAGLRRVMSDDARIIALRVNVRKAAESQLANGVIDATALLAKISDENIAEMTARFHENTTPSGNI